MSDVRPLMDMSPRDAELLAAHAEGLLDDAQAAELNARLHAEPRLLLALAELAELDEHLHALCSETNATDRGEWFKLMSLLAKGADDAEVVHLTDEQRRAHRRSSAKDSHLFALPQVAWLGGIAAGLALLITLTLALAFSGDRSNDPGTSLTDDAAAPQTPDIVAAPAAPAAPAAVATLTATHNATWAEHPAEGASAPGETLYAGQTLTLTTGFAEITTNRGAVAILEAPATIELLDSDNAIRLHTGKLVGICETDASKGFLVRTPHMDITDLGTRFAVAVEPDAEHGEAQSASEVIVMEGKVRVQPSPEAGVAFEPVQLSASESVRCETSGRGLLPTKRAAADFYRSIPDAYEQYVREQGPVGYWRFEQNSALSLLSNLGHCGDRLTGIGRIEPDPRGAVGSSARFDGQSRVELNAPRGLDLIHSFTIASWIYLEPGGDGIQRVFSNGLLRNGKPTAGFGLGVDRLSTDRAYAFFTFYGIADYRSSTAALPTGRWVHLAVSVDRAGQPTFYIDGIAVRHQLRANPSEQTPPPSGRPSDADAWIADAQVGANMPAEAFQGRIDELLIIPKPLSSEQIEWLARKPEIQP